MISWLWNKFCSGELLYVAPTLVEDKPFFYRPPKLTSNLDMFGEDEPKLTQQGQKIMSLIESNPEAWELESTLSANYAYSAMDVEHTITSARWGVNLVILHSASGRWCRQDDGVFSRYDVSVIATHLEKVVRERAIKQYEEYQASELKRIMSLGE
jgi:hypothetical protein